ncbi:hypothetical protein LX97_00645 [Nonlabens dokdonensis]|jgi:uncharacterized tellurite resistance protein B-like protein|uniref:Co-chaperone DjlA N-terminal domain-containing protein n=2 Tax=Nonlabens dokdonensis TaxID=328515 RepID=L7W6Z7_NONDD|nr:hypothetical protein [Nonlabens dokdonensis]AGC75967.1 hypothetical protein DDD_0840 [Nonlabens dokdonensis DSW-6]PZX43644.1 hypothetical protein LX97_00645 [Nonlabens dokdonensis]
MITNQLKGHFLRLYQIAFADDSFDKLELEMLYKFANDRGLTKEQLDSILLNPSIDTSIPESLETRIEYLYDLAIMIWADGRVDDDEYITLTKYCKKFEFLDENIEALADFLLKSAKEGVSKTEIINSINS